jgi:ubiquinone/menaquinone biosynthesis C-methylase UbiE
MALHPLSERFADVADVYERGRPEYAPAVVGALAAELRIAPGAPVLDLAAGTGKLTRALVGFGFDVVAVEPLASLRELLAASVGEERVREGVAEAIPLPDASMAAVTVADGFHWFDQAAALAEIRRVLRPRGGLAVVAALPDWAEASWADEVGKLLAELRPEHPGIDGPPWQNALRAAGGWTEPREISVTSSQPTTAERFVDFIASMSWVAALPAGPRAETLSRVQALIAAGETPSQMRVHVQIGLTSLA